MTAPDGRSEEAREPVVDEPTPPCAACGEHAEPWPFACPECGRVHHARCWRLRGGCAVCDCRTHEPRPEHGAAPPPRAAGWRWAYLRFVALLQQRLHVPLGPVGVAVALAALATGVLLLVVLVWV